MGTARLSQRTGALGPAVYTVYDHPQWWIVYHLVGNSIRVVSITRAD
jgi:hypothetical protein